MTSWDHFQVPGLWLPALGSRCGKLLGAHMPHTWKHRELVPMWSRPLEVRATPRCSPLLPGEEEPEASHERLLRRSRQVQSQMGGQVRTWPWMDFPSFLPTFPSHSVLLLGME